MIGSPHRLQNLLDAEARGLALLDAIERAGLVAPGRSERAIEADILALAARDFGVSLSWHPELVRAGSNTTAIAGEPRPDAIVQDDDIVFVDLGPVFGEWEADVGRSYAVGPDPRKHALVAELPRQFECAQTHFAAHPDITGAAFYDFVVRSAEAAGWRFGGKIAGHIVGEYNHRDWPGGKDSTRIGPLNTEPLNAPDPFGRARFWIIEIHLVAPEGSFGGFYERLGHRRPD